MPKLRQNIITGDYVVIAPERAKRPEDFIAERPKAKKTKIDCPFCPGGKGLKEVIKDAGTSRIAVIPNRFPAFVLSEQIIEEGGRFYSSGKAFGGHEVIIIKDHHEDIFDLSAGVATDLWQVFQERYCFYRQMPEIEYIMGIYNYQVEAGASVEHPHAQLFASSVMPSYIQKELKGSLEYFLHKGQCVFCQILEEEKGDGRRMVTENNDFLAFNFFASRVPFEIWIVPKDHRSDFFHLDSATIQSLAEIFRKVMERLDQKLKNPPFNFYLHTLPAKKDHSGQHYHWHLEILPRLSRLGAYELGSGIYIDVVSPEMCARFLR
jgi:UDPglucose--hexose-1-phosphate uridylyltransferase